MRLGRLNENLAAAPTEAPPEPKTAPQVEPGRPTTPSKPRPSPFNPPRPHVQPTPKNKMPQPKAQMVENYDGEAHPSTRSFWKDLPKNKQHAFAKHPILAMHGDELSRSSYEHTRAKQGGKLDMQGIMRLYQAIQMIESKHAEELVALAKKVTTKIWGIGEDQLQGQLGGGVDVNSASDKSYGEQPDLTKVASDDAMRPHVNKRLTMNTLTHGSAVHAMMSMHHIVDEEIKKIDPRLLQLYNKISSGAHQFYWLMDIPAMFAHLPSMAAGSTKVEWPEEDGAQPVVNAKGVIFPVLCQEMVKGVAEMISMHGLGDLDEPTQRHTLEKADDIRHEPYLIQVGPELWRRFLKLKPPNLSNQDLMMALSTQPSDELHKIVSAVVESPEIAKQLLTALVSEGEDFNLDDQV